MSSRTILHCDMTVYGSGENQYITIIKQKQNEKDTEEGRAMNRRVEIEILK